MFFWNSLAFPIIQRMLAISSLVLLPFIIPEGRNLILVLRFRITCPRQFLLNVAAVGFEPMCTGSVVSNSPAR